MTENFRCITVESRPFTEHPCGCVFYPPLTEGRYIDTFGDGPRQWQPGTHYEAWTDTSGCTEGHGRGANLCPHCGREIEYGSCRWTDCPGNAGVEDTNYL